MAQIPRVRVLSEPSYAVDSWFAGTFRIGRAEDSDVAVKNEFVSRNHAEVFLDNGAWWVRDLGSSNGIFVNGERVERAPLGAALKIRLGIEGPFLTFEVEQPPPPPVQRPALNDREKLAQAAKHYLGGGSGAPAGERTMYIRAAFAQVQAKQKRKYGGIVALIAVLALAAAGYAFYLHRQASKQKALAENIFYNMKSLDVDIANLQRMVMNSNDRAGAEEIRKFHDRRAQMEKSYGQFLATLHIYDRKMTPRQQLVLRIARVFGECEIDMPPEFETEIGNYIGKWQSSGRYARDIKKAQDAGYIRPIVQQLLAQDLPPQFFYLALQESDFDPYISGPMTRKGIAKGMWQFIPETALKYGLHLGPLLDLPRVDPGDDRHHWDRETVAASKYLKELYSTDAQASGLLVMACYNWGEDYVLPLVRSLPENPRDRNFWKLLTAHKDKIPRQTYDYVFYISSAAIIGENPRLFGFDFDNPLETAR